MWRQESEGTLLIWTRILLVAFAGGLGAGLANAGIVFFHDAIRSTMPEFAQGRMPHREYASLALGSSLGLLIGFGIPFSLVSSAILAHGLWLGTDALGTWFPGPLGRLHGFSWKRYLGLAGSILCGALYGGLLVAALFVVSEIVARLPVNFFEHMGSLGQLAVFTLAGIPALTIAYQYGVRHGVIAFVITLAARQVASALGRGSPDTWGFLVGMLVLAFYVIREARVEAPPAETFAISEDPVRRIRRNLPWIAVVGATYGLVSNLGVIMEGPQALLALASGDRMAAASYTLARALSLMPMRAMSMLATGAFTMENLGLAPTAGLLSPTPLVAAIAGAVVMTLETLSLVGVARLFRRFPCLLQVANNMRTAMTRLLELACLVGGLIAANGMLPGFGLLAVAGFYCLNEAAGTPVIRVAVGPIAILLLGVALNLASLWH